MLHEHVDGPGNVQYEDMGRSHRGSLGKSMEAGGHIPTTHLSSFDGKGKHRVGGSS